MSGTSFSASPVSPASLASPASPASSATASAASAASSTSNDGNNPPDLLMKFIGRWNSLVAKINSYGFLLTQGASFLLDKEGDYISISYEKVRANVNGEFSESEINKIADEVIYDLADQDHKNKDEAYHILAREGGEGDGEEYSSVLNNTVEVAAKAAKIEMEESARIKNECLKNKCLSIIEHGISELEKPSAIMDSFDGLKTATATATTGIAATAATGSLSQAAVHKIHQLKIQFVETGLMKSGSVATSMPSWACKPSAQDLQSKELQTAFEGLLSIQSEKQTIIFDRYKGKTTAELMGDIAHCGSFYYNEFDIGKMIDEIPKSDIDDCKKGSLSNYLQSIKDVVYDRDFLVFIKNQSNPSQRLSISDDSVDINKYFATLKELGGVISEKHIKQQDLDDKVPELYERMKGLRNYIKTVTSCVDLDPGVSKKLNRLADNLQPESERLMWGFKVALKNYADNKDNSSISCRFDAGRIVIEKANNPVADSVGAGAGADSADSAAGSVAKPTTVASVYPNSDSKGNTTVKVPNVNKMEGDVLAIVLIALSNNSIYKVNVEVNGKPEEWVKKQSAELLKFFKGLLSSDSDCKCPIQRTEITVTGSEPSGDCTTLNTSDLWEAAEKQNKTDQAKAVALSIPCRG